MKQNACTQVIALKMQSRELCRLFKAQPKYTAVRSILFSFALKKLGIECIYIDKNASDQDIDKVFKSNTKAVFGETIANPALTVFDIERFAHIAHRHNVPLIVDNTFATPVLCKPIEYGADIVIRSTSK